MPTRLRSMAFCVALVLVGVAGGFHLRAQAPAASAAQTPAGPPPADTAELRAQYERWRTEFKTWGKWGTEDNKGTSNLITPQKVLSAVRLVRNGIVVSLAAPVPQVAAADVQPAGLFRRTTNNITEGGTTDTIRSAITA